MKRSEINRAIKDVKAALNQAQFPLPPFAHYSVEEWKKLGEEEEEIVENMLGWDVTDFGSGDFKNIGLTVFTFRNGNTHLKGKYPKSYAEKILYVKDGQILPFHYHWEKREDIINRGGGDLELTLFNASEEDFADVDGGRSCKPGKFASSDVIVHMDGKRVVVPNGGTVILHPGQSITLSPGQYHQWQGIPGTGDVILFEVSSTNDDTIDNRFYAPGDRIPEIEEDEDVNYLIFADYPKYTKFTFVQ